MAYSITPTIGTDLVNTTTAVNIANGSQVPLFALGDQVWANDGKRYVYAKANASIGASTAVCTVNAATFLATASGGAYTSPATAMVTGDYGWFGSASV
jgi:NADPH:quinone reductase-like Zn-dependent oxidoreductase